MLEVGNIVVWIDRDQGKIFVTEVGWGDPNQHGMKGHWCDPIGAAYEQWREMNGHQRLQLMLETAIDLAMNGFDLGAVLREFAKVRQFRALGDKSYPMCRALTKALIGHSYEFNTMGFERLLVTYG
jgi:hypothetical protein